MRITCPICAAQYDLPPALAAKLPARTRCVRCGNEWEARSEEVGVAEAVPSVPVSVIPRPAASAEVPASKAAPAIAAAPEVPERPAAVTPGGPDGRRLWIGSVALVVLFVVLFLGFHGAIGRAWPASMRLYRALGLG